MYGGYFCFTDTAKQHDCFSVLTFLREICYGKRQGKGGGRKGSKKKPVWLRGTRPRIILFWQRPKRTFLYARCNLSSMFGGWVSRPSLWNKGTFFW